jgi:hypothetical protein
LSGRTAQTGLLVAAATVPETFASSLTPRSWTDQGIATGLAACLEYLLTVTTQDGAEALAAAVAARVPWFRAAGPVAGRRAAGLAVDLAIVSAGVGAQRLLIRQPEERVRRGMLRQAGWRTTRTGASAAILTAVQLGTSALDRRVGAEGRIARLPVAVPAGLALATVLDRIHHVPVTDDDVSSTRSTSGNRSAMGTTRGGSATIRR